jgi:hypothetical protein
MGYIDYESEETPEERRMRLLAEMGSPYLGNRRDADLGTVDSSGAFGFMPQGYSPQPDAAGLSMLGSPYLDPGQASGGSGAPWLDPGQRVPGSYRDPGSDYVDPGTVQGGSGTPYTDPPPRLGNLFSKPQEPAAPEQDGILFNGTRSPAGLGVLGQATPDAAIPSGPIASPADVNLQGANGQDRSNAPRSPDAPQTAAPMGLPSMAGGIGGSAAAYAARTPQPGAAPSAAGDDEEDAPAAKTPAGKTPASPSLPPPQAAAAADGLSRKPGSPAAMTWLQDNADLFIAIGAGLLSGKNMGEGIIQGLRLANESKTTNAKLKLEAEKNQAENLRKAASSALLQKAFGMSPDVAIASAENADLVKRAGQIVFPDPESADWVRTTDANGTEILRNKKTGDEKPAPKAEKVAAKMRPATAADLPVGQDPARFQVNTETDRVEPISGTEPKLSPQEEADKKARELKITGGGTRLNKLAEGRIEAQTASSMADYAQELLSGIEPGLKTGALSKLAQYGVHLDSNADKVQAAQAVLRRMAALQRTAGGDQSNYELQALEAQVPSLIGTKEGNQAILDTMKSQAKYLDDASRIAAEYQTDPKMGQEEALRRIGQLPDPFTRMKQYAAERGAAAAPAANPGSAPAPGPGPSATAPASGARVPMYDPKTRTFR